MSSVLDQQLVSPTSINALVRRDHGAPEAAHLPKCTPVVSSCCNVVGLSVCISVYLVSPTTLDSSWSRLARKQLKKSNKQKKRATKQHRTAPHQEQYTGQCTAPRTMHRKIHRTKNTTQDNTPHQEHYTGQYTAPRTIHRTVHRTTRCHLTLAVFALCWLKAAALFWAAFSLSDIGRAC